MMLANLSLRQLVRPMPMVNIQVRTATKKAGGSSRNGRDSIGKRLGLKRADGQLVTTGCILIRQRGSSVHAGLNVGVGRDFTLYALTEGYMHFRFNRKIQRSIIDVLPERKKPKPKKPLRQIGMNRGPLETPKPAPLSLDQVKL